jgi:uncharacterized RDD family membrane protein YckC
VRACNFCDSSFSVGFSAMEEPSGISAQAAAPVKIRIDVDGMANSTSRALATNRPSSDPAWRSELARRLGAYRSRRRKHLSSEEQSHFSFEESAENEVTPASVAIEETPVPGDNDFSFTIAIGRPSEKKPRQESAMEIDVSSRPDADGHAETEPLRAQANTQPGLFPVASIYERKLAAAIDLFCLLFAYGSFLSLFGSLGGHFTLSKLSVAVCGSILAIVYAQYFTLFTIFGGTTPGMMMRGLQVASFSAEPPTSRQMLLRSAGYLLSGTFFLGFLWALWDADELTWHDHLSRTYLTAEQTLPELGTHDVAGSR